MAVATPSSVKDVVGRHGQDLATILARIDGDEFAGFLGALRPSYLSRIEDELHDVHSEIEHIAFTARDATGANPTIDGDEREFISLDAEHAWHLSAFARTIRIKAAELLDCADKVESSAYFGWQNRLDAEQAALHHG